MTEHLTYYNKRLILLRWAAGAATLFQLFLLTMDFFGKAVVFQEVTEFYLFILWTYGIKNLLVSWKGQDKSYWGDVFVYIVWIYCAGIYCWAAAHNTPGVVPAQLKFTWEGVTVLYISTGVLGIIKKLFFEDIKRFFREVFGGNGKQ